MRTNTVKTTTGKEKKHIVAFLGFDILCCEIESELISTPVLVLLGFVQGTSECKYKRLQGTLAQTDNWTTNYLTKEERVHCCMYVIMYR